MSSLYANFPKSLSDMPTNHYAVQVPAPTKQPIKSRYSELGDDVIGFFLDTNGASKPCDFTIDTQNRWN